MDKEGEKKFLIGMVLDSTGSMNSIKSDALGGFNEYVQSMQRDDEGDTRFTLCVFNSQQIDFPYTASTPAEVELLTDRTYVCQANTPLYDAIGKTISKMDAFLEEHPAFTDDQRQRATLTILTDGLENASQEYTRDGVVNLIEERKARGWAVIFLAANIDAFATGRQMGIDQSNTSQFAARKMRQSMQVAYKAHRTYMDSDGRQQEDLISDEDRADLADEE